MMATSISLPTKREHEGGAGEEEAWKKTKTEEACSDDESMSDYRAEKEDKAREYQLLFWVNTRSLLPSLLNYLLFRELRQQFPLGN